MAVAAPLQSDTPNDPPSKRSAILEGATRVFLASGYGPASMDSIAAEAGVSKQTVYSHFGSKDALFEAMVRQKCDDLTSPMADSEIRGDNPEEVLIGLGRRFMELVLLPAHTRLFRAIVAESERFPELAEGFYRAGPRQGADQLAEYLAELDRKGTLRIPQPKASAELFFATMRADLYMRSILALSEEPDTDEIDQQVTLAVAAFLAAHRTT